VESGPAGARPGTLPSPLASIDRSTPPQVAAATRLTEEGRVQLESGDSDAALERFERAIAIDPTNLYAYYFLGEVHLQRGNYEQAITFADRAVALSTNGDHAWLARACALQGQVYEAAGRFADARDAYQRALQANPGEPSAVAGLGRVGSGMGATP
jgi:tetratricopeptide (TPR) repeat protein